VRHTTCRTHAHSSLRGGNFLGVAFAPGHVEMNLSIGDVGSRHWLTAM
jgi:hypothetical protein